MFDASRYSLDVRQQARMDELIYQRLSCCIHPPALLISCHPERFPQILKVNLATHSPHSVKGYCLSPPACMGVCAVFSGVYWYSMHTRTARDKRLGRPVNKLSNSSLLPTSSQRAALAMSGHFASAARMRYETSCAQIILDRPPSLPR